MSKLPTFVAAFMRHRAQHLGFLRMLCRDEALACLVGCGGGGQSVSSAASGPAVMTVQEWYDPATKLNIRGSGTVLLNSDGSPSAIKHGAWVLYFSVASGGGVQWEQVWRQGEWDRQQPWVEYNADTSIRENSLDE